MSEIAKEDALKPFVRTSLTKEDFENRIEPGVQRIAEIIMAVEHPPEGVTLSDALGILQTLKSETELSVGNKVPEVAALRSKLETKEKQVRELQTLNHELFLRAGRIPAEEEKKVEPEQARKMSFEEIGRALDAMPG